jgi:DTW domain-containing protein
MVRPFIARQQFVILIHRDEARRAVATGRMASLCIKNSILLEGTDFSRRDEVNEILDDSTKYPVVLFPSQRALNISDFSPPERLALFPSHKQLVIFVVDGTWATARKMRRLSDNLRALPEIRFQPRKPSGFLVRKQPSLECLSTIESIHEVIELLEDSDSARFRPHDNLLEVFSFMVRIQSQFQERHGRLAVRGTRNTAQL